MTLQKTFNFYIKIVCILIIIYLLIKIYFFFYFFLITVIFIIYFELIKYNKQVYTCNFDLNIKIEDDVIKFILDLFNRFFLNLIKMYINIKNQSLLETLSKLSLKLICLYIYIYFNFDCCNKGKNIIIIYNFLFFKHSFGKG